MNMVRFPKERTARKGNESPAFDDAPATDLDLPTRERLLDAAMIEFGERGLNGARVDEIAKRAKANKQLVYHYFGGKDELYMATLTRSYKRYCSGFDRLKTALIGLDTRSALLAFIEQMFVPSLDSSCFRRLLQDANSHGGRHTWQLDGVRTAYEGVMTILSEILKKGADEGIFRSGLDPREVYVSIVGTIGMRLSRPHSLSMSLGLELTTVEGAKASRDQAIEFILHALRP